jgi:hypothetical protein
MKKVFFIMKKINVKKIAPIPEGSCRFKIESARTETKGVETKIVVRFTVTYEANDETKSRPLVQKYFTEYFEGSAFSVLIAYLTDGAQPDVDEFDIDRLVGLTGEGYIKHRDYNGGTFENLEIISVD